MATDESADGVLARAVRLLEAFDARSTSLTVSELSRRSNLPIATTSRMVAELTRLGLLVRAGDGRRIQPGLRLWELAARAAPTRDLREAALPFMEDLHAVIRHHVQLGVLQDREVLFLERLSAREAVINVTEVAGRLPLHASSTGLVLLAHASPEVQGDVLARPLRRFTAATITTPDALRATLAEIRRTDVVITAGHIHADAAGVAVPVRDQAGRVVAALGAVVPNDGAALRTIPALHAAAQGIRRSISHR